MSETAWTVEDPEIRWLVDVTSLPTAAGKEQHVIAWIERWVRERPDIRLTKDQAGNMVVDVARSEVTSPPAGRTKPLFITAHLDHPAFVIERIIGPGTVSASFRGGVHDPYFTDARVRLFTASGERGPGGTITSREKREPFSECLIELDGDSDDVVVGDIARWDLPDALIEGDLIYTHACDDLSAVAAALATMDRLLARGRGATEHVKLLFTRAEEIGFIGAIAACKLATIPKDARILALENSRSFAESPIGGGPIVRVGDRVSTFSPALTGAVAKVAETLAAAPQGAFKWQRKLMAGGACEASAYQAYGYDATCICLPLGNYHNMTNLDRVQPMKPDEAEGSGLARIGHEYISISDYKGMIGLLEACATGLTGAEPLVDRMERLYREKSFVL